MLVIPSYFKADQPSNFNDFTNNNFSLKIGQIIKANYPNVDKDKNSFITYDVMVNDQQDSQQYNVIYYDCMPMQLFGSAADYFEYTLRANIADGQKKDDLLTKGAALELSNDSEVKKLLGATVIIACVGGDASNAVIIGALPSFFLEQNTKYEQQSKEDGKFLKFSFNGIYVNINDDGELIIKRNGPTKSDAELDTDSDGGKEENIGSLIQIDKEGSVIISAGVNDDDSEDAVKPQIKMTKEGNVSVVTPKAEITIDKDGVVNVTAEKMNIISNDINSGDKGLSPQDYIAKSFKTLNEMNKIIQYLTAINAIFTGPPIPEPGMGAPSMLQTALQIAAQAVGGVPSLQEPKCDTTKVK